MLDETIFQIILAASLAVLAIMRIYYRIKSGAFRESKFQKRKATGFWYWEFRLVSPGLAVFWFGAPILNG